MQLSGSDSQNLTVSELRNRMSKDDLPAMVEMAHRQLIGEVMPFEQEFVLKAFTKGSEAGIARARSGLADCHMWGVGMRRDTSQVMELLEMAAEQGDPLGTYRLGWYCCHGVLLKQDFERGLKLIRKASGLGSLDADAGLARLTLTGYGVPKDESAGLSQLRSLAEERGSSQAAMILADFYRGKFAEGAKQDPVLATKYLLMAGEKNHAGALVALGDLAMEKSDRQGAANCYRKAIARNSGEGMYKLGSMQMRDASVRMEGEDWYQLLLAADAVGHGPATLKLAQVNYHAPGYTFRDLDWKKSAGFYERWIAENPGEWRDQYMAVEKLLEMYFEGGLGLDRDFNRCIVIAQPQLDYNVWAAAYAGRVLLHQDAPLGNTREHFIRGYACLLKSRVLWKMQQQKIYWLSDEALFVLRSRHGMTREEVARAEELVQQGFPNPRTPLLP